MSKYLDHLKHVEPDDEEPQRGSSEPRRGETRPQSQSYDRFRDFEPGPYNHEIAERAQQILEDLERRDAEAAAARARETTRLVNILQFTEIKKWTFKVVVDLDQEEWTRLKLIGPKAVLVWGHAFRIPIHFQNGRSGQDLEIREHVSIEGHLCVDRDGDIVLAEADFRPLGPARAVGEGEMSEPLRPQGLIGG